MNRSSTPRKFLPLLELGLGVLYGALTFWLAGRPDQVGSFNISYYYIPGLLFGVAVVVWEWLRYRTYRSLPLIPLSVLLYFISALLALHFTFDSPLLRIVIGLGVGGLNAAVYTFLAVERLRISLLPTLGFTVAAGMVSVIPYILNLPNYDFWVYMLYGSGMLMALAWAKAKSSLEF